VSTQHEEFQGFTPETQAAVDAALNAVTGVGCYRTLSLNDLLRALAASLREAMKHAGTGYKGTWWDDLDAIANNLHSPPPPPPTLTQARAADLDTPAGRDVVRAFLATLGEGVQ